MLEPCQHLFLSGQIFFACHGADDTSLGIDITSVGIHEKWVE